MHGFALQPALQQLGHAATLSMRSALFLPESSNNGTPPGTKDAIINIKDKQLHTQQLLFCRSPFYSKSLTQADVD